MRLARFVKTNFKYKNDTMKRSLTAAVFLALSSAPSAAIDIQRAANIYGIITFFESHCIGYKIDDRKVWSVMSQIGVTIDDIDRQPLRTKVVDVIEDLIKRQKQKGVSCAASVALFGPNGTSIRGLIVEQ